MIATMGHISELAILLSVLMAVALAGELTFELPDNEKQCFQEIIDKGVKCTLEFQVNSSDLHMICS